jgi:hypothetical protein
MDALSRGLPIQAYYFVNQYFSIRISADTVAALDAQFPGWDSPPKGRRGARARQGAKLFENAVNAISELAWHAGQEIEGV